MTKDNGAWKETKIAYYQSYFIKTWWAIAEKEFYVQPRVAEAS